MVGEAIRGILDGGARKVIIPGCGTFIRRESGELVFTELLRTDDGKLTAALAASRDIAPEAARKLVESYAATLNRKLAGTGRMTVEGVGTIVRTAAGNYTVEPQNGTVSQQTESEPIRQTESPAATDVLTEEGVAQTADTPGQPTRMRKNGRRRPRPVSDRKRSSRTKESGRRQSTPPHRPTDATARAGCAVRSTVTGSRTTKRPRNINNRFPKVCRTRRVPYHRQQYLPRQRRRPPLPGMTEQRNIRLKSISGGPASPKNGRMRCSSSQSSHSPSR